MKISSDSKLGVALKVLRKIRLKEDEVHIDTYSNCREQGFFISFFDYTIPFGQHRCVSFSENRNSDDIIVQYGVRDDFTPYGVFLTDEKYRNCKKYFRYDEPDKAAKFITKWLTSAE